MKALVRNLVVGSAAVATSLTLSSCGTVLVNNNFSVTIDDPSNRLPSGPVQVSVFDSQMGQSAEWAQKSMGTATPGAPYTTSFKTTATKIVGDSNPPERVSAGLSIPEYQAKGYFRIELVPVDGAKTTINAPFAGYYDYTATKDGAVEPLTLQITSSAGELSWNISIQALIPNQ